MSQFTNTLSAALKSAGKTQTDIANTLGINPSLVSRWANNKTDLREETLVRLLSQIPAEHHKMLIESYLLDRCPEQYRALISFGASGEGVVREDAGTYTAAAAPVLPERTRRAIDTLARLCESNPPLRRMLTDLSRLLTDPHAASAPADPDESENKIHKQALEKYHETGGTWHPEEPTDSTHTSAG